MSAAQDHAATVLAQNLVNTLIKLGIDPLIAVNALAGALGCYVAAAAHSGEAEQLMREMCSQAHTQMTLQLAIIESGMTGPVAGHA